MTQRQYVREKLAPHHDLRNFKSGQEELDLWFFESTLKTGDRDYGRTYIWYDGANQVLAFFTLSAYVINSKELPPKQARGQQRIIPAILLGKFALDQSLQRKGFGEVLLADAVREAVKASEISSVNEIIFANPPYPVT
ncbi:MAG: hypothetical protein HY050_07370 [Actinobacteria bacterium]|nr:hypothetical protein [Actinomycetota bacterium]